MSETELDAMHFRTLVAFARDRGTSLAVKRYSPLTVVADLPEPGKAVYPKDRGRMDAGELWRVRLGNDHYQYGQTLGKVAVAAMRAFEPEELEVSRG